MLGENHTDFNEVRQSAAYTQAKSFLGREFLLWCWFQSETAPEGIEIQTAKGAVEPVEIWVDDRIEFVGTTGGNQVITQRGGEPSASVESAAALLSGKSLRELRLGLCGSLGIEWTCLINSQELVPKSIRVLKVESDNEEAAPTATDVYEGKLRDIQLFFDAFDGVFAKFLEVRLESSWAEEVLPQIKTWIRGRTSRHGASGKMDS